MSTDEPIPQQALTRGSDALVELPVTVWPTAQQAPRTQRGNRYVPEGTAHPAKMLPAIARHAVDTFTAPGDLVLDPMCGVGTTLIEAVRKGRDALGIEYESRWAEVTDANLALAASDDATGRGEVHVGDARHVLPALAERYAGRVGLLVTSPPYGSSVHGQVHAPGHRPVRKRDDRYGKDRANLAHRSLPSLLRGFTDILRRAVPLLRPGGVVAITTRPFRIDGELIDFPHSPSTPRSTPDSTPSNAASACWPDCATASLSRARRSSSWTTCASCVSAACPPGSSHTRTSWFSGQAEPTQVRAS
ncbi:TRM11 family SAM-dependent methyltransferase [Saccharomonospora piscinae]|uniref:TRM11 family SAM-dependent methyltransferase n=1 Tax=Saccharomonospora piscinae TaxID=687388 RepID=UPI0004B16E6F|nr:DNA methyltransferase [Saccharomonospora piscinae]